MSDLYCDHCGGIAFTSRDHCPEAAEGQGAYFFEDGSGEACAECGFPGHVVVDGDSDNDLAVSVQWTCRDGNDDTCKDPLCEECTDARLDLGEITPAKVGAIAAVRAIVADLTDRRGLKREWHAIEREIQWSIVETWIGHVETHVPSQSNSKGTT